MKSNLFKLVFFSIASILFTIFFILFIVNSEIFRENMPAFYRCYYIIYCLCILVVDTLFIFKTVEFSKKVYAESNSPESKQKHAQAKAERAEEAKQAKIQALEAELEELKND